MAGLPPLFGFLAKETLLATATHPSVPPIMDVVFPIITVIAGSFMIALSGMFIWEVFHAPAKQKINFSHRPPFWMVAMPAIPATISLGLGLLPEPKWLAGFLAQAAKNAYNAPVKVSLALWTGISVPVILSAVVVIFGTLLFINRQVIRNWQNKIFASFSIEKIYDNSLNILDRIANLAVRLQAGRLRIYLAIMLLSVGFLVFAFGELPFQTFFGDFRLFQNPTNTETNFLRLYVLFITIGASLASLVIQRDVYAILALGISGLAVATWFLLEPAPDVALVQVVVDILSIVILVLALVRLPKSQRQMIPSLNIRIKRLGFWRDLLISLAAGVVVTLISYQALISRPRTSLVTPYYQFNARSMTGATDVVSAVLVDFRGFDTMNEIIVFSVAGLGIYALLRTAIPVNKSQTTSKTDPDCASEPQARDASSELHITNPRSPLVRVLATLTLPLAFMIALTHIMFGHIQPGDGFTAGVILSLAIGLSYIIFGYYQTIDKIAWLNPRTFIASGILLILLSGTASWLFNGAFLSNQDFSNFLNFPKPPGFKISSSFFFEIGIFLVVLGSTDLMIDSLGHPGERIDCVEKVDILE
jgi:multicomponent K+:H+ antiporter subunit A